MPYVDIEQRRANHRLHKKKIRLELLDQEGCRPLDSDDPTSMIECLVCGKLSGRHANRKWRHWPECTMVKVRVVRGVRAA